MKMRKFSKNALAVVLAFAMLAAVPIGINRLSYSPPPPRKIMVI